MIGTTLADRRHSALFYFQLWQECGKKDFIYLCAWISYGK
ncbi:hypothetical protein FORC066_1213 [Yersinia enterocolitica]|nr:hypothetical protein FORC066_1213 [Yersinia enterocolitica]